MKIIRWLMTAAVLVAGAAAISACSKSKGNDNAAKTTAADTTPAGQTPSSGATSAPTTASGDAASGGSGDLADAAEKFKKSTFHATYKATSSGDSFAGGQFVMYKDGEKRLRFEASVKQDGQTMDVIFISTEDVYGFCLKDAGELGGLLGIEPGKGVCFKVDPNDPNNPVGDISSLFQDLETGNTTLLDKSSRKIAGKDTTCYHTKDNSTGEIGTACLTNDGILMSVQTEGADAFEMEATDVSGSVGGGDFALPYEVRDLPGFGG